MVDETEGEEEEEEEEDGLEYTTDTLSGDSYPENNAVLHTEELEAHIEVFLEEAEEDMDTGGKGAWKPTKTS